MKLEEVLPALRAGKTITMVIRETQFYYKLENQVLLRSSMYIPDKNRGGWWEVTDSLADLLKYDWSIEIETFDFFEAIARLKAGKLVVVTTDPKQPFFMEDGQIGQRFTSGPISKGAVMYTGNKYKEYDA